MEIAPIRPISFGMQGMSRAMGGVSTAAHNIAYGNQQPNSNLVNNIIELKASELSYEANGKVVQTSFDMIGVLFDDFA